MAAKMIPKEVKAQIEEIIANFNRKTFLREDMGYQARYGRSCLYLDKYGFGRTRPICRLTYTGDMQAWEFSIYKYSDNGYDPTEWLFPGAEEVDGTIEGAMRACRKAYPF
jgi:hypothetical protein